VLVLVLVQTVLTQGANSRTEKRRRVLPELANHTALPLLDLDFCGSGSESQISRGPLSCGFPIVGDHPWLVALGFRQQDGTTTYQCTGVIVSDRYVVTSARCATGKPVTVRASEYDFSSLDDCLWYAPETCIRSVEREVDNVKIHPRFPSGSVASGLPSLDDIAVVQLNESLVFDYGVMSICLPIFPDRQPPNKQFALSFGLGKDAQPKLDASATCCNCSRKRNATSHLMDKERVIDAGATYNGTNQKPCHYRLLKEGSTGNECIGDGEPCIADLGSPLVSPDRFGTYFYLMGVATLVPVKDVCRTKPGASVFYLPIKPHVKWLLDAMAELAELQQNVQPERVKQGVEPAASKEPTLADIVNA